MTAFRSKLEIGFTQPTDFSEINDLFNLVFRQTRSIDAFLRQFTESPWDAHLPAAIVARHAGRIVGAFGLMPHRLNVHGEILDAIQVVDVCVHSDFQRAGVNRAILEFFLLNGSRFAALAFGFPGPTYAAIGFEKLGFRKLTTMFSFARSMPSPFRDRMHSTEYIVESHQQPPPDWEPLLVHSQTKFKISTLRSVEYFHWRYLRNEQKVFTFFTVRKGPAIEGIAIARLVADAPAPAIWIYELLAVDAKAIDSLTAAMERNFASSPACEIVYWCSEYAPWQLELRNLGFREVGREPTDVVYLTLGTENSKLSDSFEATDWFLTLGDSDL